MPRPCAKISVVTTRLRLQMLLRMAVVFFLAAFLQILAHNYFFAAEDQFWVAFELLVSALVYTGIGGYLIWRLAAQIEAAQAASVHSEQRLRQQLDERIEIQTILREREEQLRKMLAEKEILLKEVHHRVKNNLQIVISLLSLRAESVEDAHALKVFQDCENSIRAIALIHEHIYQSSNLAEIDAQEYFHNLVDHLLVVYADQASGLTLNLDVEPIALDIDSAIPCGLIVTELFSNIIKHAFPMGNQEGALWIGLGRKAKNYVLSVRDNGTGFAPDFNLRNPASMGLQLVGILVERLEGTLTLENQGGAMFTIQFPYREISQG